MTLLDSVTMVAQEIGVPAPASLVGSSVAADLQMLAVANRSIRSLVDPWPWSVQIVDYNFTFIAAQEFYTAPADYGKPINQTQWDTSLRRPLTGPINPQDWQFFKNWGAAAGVWPRFRIKGNRVQIDPVPDAGGLDTATASYFSKFGVVLATPQTIDAVVYGNGRTFQADEDGFFCDEALFELEFKWRYLRAKGLDYAEEMADAERALYEWLNSDGSKQVLDAGDAPTAWPNCIPGNIIGPFPSGS